MPEVAWGQKGLQGVGGRVGYEAWIEWEVGVGGVGGLGDILKGISCVDVWEGRLLQSVTKETGAGNDRVANDGIAAVICKWGESAPGNPSHALVMCPRKHGWA